MVALLRDERVTVSRGGLITARLPGSDTEPGRSGVDRRQADWVDHAMASVGRDQVAEFPS